MRSARNNVHIEICSAFPTVTLILSYKGRKKITHTHTHTHTQIVLFLLFIFPSCETFPIGIARQVTFAGDTVLSWVINRLKLGLSYEKTLSIIATATYTHIHTHKHTHTHTVIVWYVVGKIVTFVPRKPGSLRESQEHFNNFLQDLFAACG